MYNKPTKKFWRAYSQLYSTRTPEQIGLALPATKKKPKGKSEFLEQIAFATWLTKNNILFYHIPNGGYRNPIEGAKFKRMGVKAGVPDICIPISKKSHHGLYIELKREGGGSLSESQEEWGKNLTEEGYLWKVAHGAEEAIEIVKEYLGLC